MRFEVIQPSEVTVVEIRYTVNLINLSVRVSREIINFDGIFYK